jgi:hypothetical protein
MEMTAADGGRIHRPGVRLGGDLASAWRGRREVASAMWSRGRRRRQGAAEGEGRWLASALGDKTASRCQDGANRGPVRLSGPVATFYTPLF